MYTLSLEGHKVKLKDSLAACVFADNCGLVNKVYVLEEEIVTSPLKGIQQGKGKQKQRIPKGKLGFSQPPQGS